MIGKYEKIFDPVYEGKPENLENALQKMRDEGVNLMISVWVVIRKLKLSILAADDVVLNSDAWKNGKEDIISKREEFCDLLEQE